MRLTLREKLLLLAAAGLLTVGLGGAVAPAGEPIAASHLTVVTVHTGTAATGDDCPLESAES